MKLTEKYVEKRELEKYLSQTFTFWNQLPEHSQMKFMNAVELQSYTAQGQIVDAGAGAFITVLRGSIYGYISSKNGVCLTLFTVRENMPYIVPPESGTGGDSPLRNVKVDKNSEILYVDGSIWQEILETSLSACNFALSVSSEHMNRILKTMDLQLFAPVGKRVAMFIREFSGEEDTLNITHNEMALRLGTAREVISRSLSALVKTGAIETERGRIKIVNRDLLESGWE